MTRILLIIFLLIATPSWAVTWYVSPTGNNSNTCTQAQSISTPKLTIRGTNSVLSCVGADTEGNTDGAGDTVIALAGTYAEEIRAGDMPGGSSGNPFTFKCETIKNPWLGETPDCDLAPTTGLCSGLPCHGMTIDWSNWLIFEGFKLTASSNLNQGINNFGSNSIFRDLEIFDTFYSCVYDEGNNNLFTRIHAHACGTRNGAYHADQGGPNDFYIPGSNNEFSYIWLHDASAGIAFWHDVLTPSNDYIHHSLIEPPDLTVSGRTVFVSGIGVYVGSGHKVANNILNHEGIYVQFGASNAEILNNTVYDNDRGNNCGVDIDATASGTDVINNILRSNTGGAVCNAGSGTTQTTNLSTDPSFVNPGVDFHLQAGSAAIDTGTNLTASGITTDYGDIVRPQGAAFDIGAHEYATEAQSGGGMSGPGIKRHKGTIQGPAGPFDF